MQDKKILFLASVALAFLIILPVVMAGEDVLFVDAGQLVDTREKHVSKAKLITINWDALNGGHSKKLQLRLFDGLELTLIRDRLDIPNPGSYVWVGHIQGSPRNTATFSVVNQKLVGDIVMDGHERYTIALHGSQHILRKLDPDMRREVEMDDAIAAPISLRTSARDIEDYCEDNKRVDLLVAYTSAARRKLGGTSAIKALINQRVSEMNSANANSGLDFRFNLVHTLETNYPEPGDVAITLPLLQRTNDRMLDHIAVARDEYKADLVSLIVSEAQRGTACGMAYVMNDLSTNFSEYAYNVVALDYAVDHLTCSSQTLAHELGHNMGNQHNRAAGSIPPLLPFAYGYQSPKQTFRTIMAYNCPDGCPRINYWSNPDEWSFGEALGIDHDANSSNSADNSRSMAEAVLHVANFRKNCRVDAEPTPTTSPPPGGSPTATPPASSYPNGQKSYAPMISKP